MGCHFLDTQRTRFMIIVIYESLLHIARLLQPVVANHSHPIIFVYNDRQLLFDTRENEKFPHTYKSIRARPKR